MTALTAEVLRQQLICAAKADLTHSVSHETVIRYLLTLGVDIAGNPRHMAAFATLTEGLRFGEATPRALLHLGVSDAA